MEQEYPDWKNLDPMFFWRYVMPKSQHHIPKVVFIDYKIENPELVRLSNKYKNVDFVVETVSNPGGQEVFLQNVDYRWRDRMEYWQWLESWTVIDYAVVNREDIENWIQPALCGVKILFSPDELNEKIEVVDTVKRIENWEWARTLLTKK